MADLVVKISGDNKDLEKTFDNIMRSVNKVESGAKSASDRMTVFGASAKTAVASIVTGVGIAGAWNWLIKGNAEMEQYQQTLGIVLKDQQKAAETLEWAQKFAASTPFEIPDIVEATTRLSAYGLTAQDILGDVGDMAAAMGKPLMQAVEAVADAQTGELERLKEFGITKQMLIDKAAALGKGEIVNAKGQITDMKGLNDTLIALIKDRYSGAMKAQSQTMNGMISNLKDALGTTGRILGKGVFDALKPKLEKTVEKLNQMIESGKIEEWGQKFGKVLEDVGTVLMGFLNILGFIVDNWDVLGPVLGAMLTAFMAFKAVSFVTGFIQGVNDALVAFNLIAPSVAPAAAVAEGGVSSLGLAFLTTAGYIGVFAAGIAGAIAWCKRFAPELADLRAKMDANSNIFDNYLYGLSTEATPDVSDRQLKEWGMETRSMRAQQDAYANEMMANDIPMEAEGGTALIGGYALVGEEGPEMLYQPRGASVVPLNQSPGGFSTVNHTGSIRVEGVNTMGQLIGATKILAADLANQVHRDSMRIPSRVPLASY